VSRSAGGPSNKILAPVADSAPWPRTWGRTIVGLIRRDGAVAPFNQSSAGKVDPMKKVRYLAVLAGVAPMAGGLIAPAAAQGAPVRSPSLRDSSAPAKTVSLRPVETRGTAPDAYSCYHLGTGSSHCNASIIHGPTWVYSPNGGKILELHDGDRVEVTCWYTNGTSVGGDNIVDHVVREHISGSFHYISGHVYDYYVDFGGKTAKQVGLLSCTE
jgi:hypothetical protein